MIVFFGSPHEKVFALDVREVPNNRDLNKLTWLFGNQPQIPDKSIEGLYIGPRASMITPWSTNAVEITQNMGIRGISRIEEFVPEASISKGFDPMVSQKYFSLTQSIFDLNHEPEGVLEITDIGAYNESEGLALNDEEITYLYELSSKYGRPLTDSEVFGFSQVNSEHCRHKIFNGRFVIDNEEMDRSLFDMIKETTARNLNGVVSAYKDNVAFIKGPEAVQFAPYRQDIPDYYSKEAFDSIISLKAETHNFPTTVEPFNGAATGSGGEIRDRLAGGQGSLPLAGTAVYMTSYPRLDDNRRWENAIPEKQWLYQSPLDILIKASNGASDFGNKFGQPLISGSVLTFEHEEQELSLGFDKVIMLAGGIGYGRREQVAKLTPKEGDCIVVLGGDNYRIGMGGAAVSSADTGEFDTGIELNAVQRSNPEMQKRAANTIRAMIESGNNPILSIHDHGAGGHLNCLSELVEETGGWINLDQLPIGDPSLSAKEIIGNESQERMGLIIGREHLDQLVKIADRERTPLYVVGEVTGDDRFTFESPTSKEKPMDLMMSDLFGSSPKTIMKDTRIPLVYNEIRYDPTKIKTYLDQVLRLESVACKDWLTNKVDRCVGGLVAKQQCVGPLQLPLNNCGVMAIDFEGRHGVATSIGHSPLSGLINPTAGSRNALTEALTNIVWAPLSDGLRSVSLSANWMWPCKNPGEDARLYAAVSALSDFAIALGINIPTGKDSLSMKQKYQDKDVLSPGTVVISAAGHCNDITRVVEPVFKVGGGAVYYLNFSSSPYELGGSAFAQTLNQIGPHCPDTDDAELIKESFDVLQKLIHQDLILAGHDISSGGMITSILEMCFSNLNIGVELDLDSLGEKDPVKLLFSENAGVLIQARDSSVEAVLKASDCNWHRLGKVTDNSKASIHHHGQQFEFDVPGLRNSWYETSYLLDRHQTTPSLSLDRYKNFKNQPLRFVFPKGFSGHKEEIQHGLKRPKAAVLREKGSNSERELAHALYLAGFDVKDVHMTDLISGRENLSDIQFLGAVGGFANSDVLGSAKGWAGAFLYNDKAKTALDQFFSREDVLSIGICNGCQLFMELDLVNPEHPHKGYMDYNDSGKHESAFTSVKIQENNSVMMASLSGCQLGVWVSNGEGKFVLPEKESSYNIIGKYSYPGYPSDPNGNDYHTAMLCSHDGRHLVTMPHIERSMFPWNWAHYPDDREDQISPWSRAFVNARNWLINYNS